MGLSSFKPVAVGVAVAAMALLSACSGQNTTSPSTVDAATKNQAQQQNQAKQQIHAGQDKAGDVNCSATGAGQVGPVGGKQADLIAVAGKAGTIGCTEAFTVITEYYRDAPSKSEGTAHVLTVRGWKCMADTGAQGSGAVGCDKDGLSFHTGHSDSTGKKFAGKTLTVELTGYDTKLDMAEFKLVKYVRGGADNGHYEPLPEDPGTHRLPLTKSPQILSVSSICSDGLTADSRGQANKPCTKDQLVRKLNDSVAPFASIQVDGDDRIAKVVELYAP
ncbi:hypothetical protein JOF56_000347 [Kibdelosporangium banguiense]|uniref:Lipoprotein n=1 Tax=Kibdelosporangium banguiense TaxID=1365924 RepID=A0ABS4T6B0_9PSEU|nr:hypothetical protein [Kibdelosporangium banguiense]MBP2319962.1 hypothetical protein [Kibdelosporangium banguiense]